MYSRLIGRESNKSKDSNFKTREIVGFCATPVAIAPSGSIKTNWANLLFVIHRFVIITASIFLDRA